MPRDHIPYLDNSDQRLRCPSCDWVSDPMGTLLEAATAADAHRIFSGYINQLVDSLRGPRRTVYTTSTPAENKDWVLRKSARHDAAAIVRTGMADVIEWLRYDPNSPQ